MAEIKIIENTSEIAAGTRGASLGVGALKVASLKADSDYFGRYERFKVDSDNNVLFEPTIFRTAKRIDALVNIYQSVSDQVSFVLRNGDFPIVLAGDHASAGGTIAGIKKAFPEKRLGVIWIDAHADLHTPYTTPSGNLHGMPMATALNEDNREEQINEPLPETIEFWNKLKSMSGIAPKILAEDIVYIGLRDMEAPEERYIERNHITVFTVEDVREKTPAKIAALVDEKLRNCDLIYVSFDVDSMDPDMVSRGTGTPAPNGLSPKEAGRFMDIFAEWTKTCCMEIVEINPCLDDKINTMAETAFEILESFTHTLENRI
ncbi:MAG: arginase [Bacteroidetes bacterium]|nr:arginase [Bacteroidota bacterium]